MSTFFISRIMYFMDHSEILSILMPERTKQIGLAWSILRQSHLSEDAYQDMLAKVLANDRIFEGPQHLRDWSWKVLRNQCYELIRRRKYQVKLLDESILNLVDAELECRDTSDVAMRADALHDCLDGLSEKARETIRMRYFDGLRGKQVAEMLGQKPETVYKALQRSYVALAECIKRKLDAPEKGASIS